VEKDLSGSKAIQKTKLGFLGGTFNPIHYGHLILAESARTLLDLTKIIFIPSGRPCYYKEEKPIDAKHRYNMTQLAIDSNPYFSILSIEIEKESPSYTIDTIKDISQNYNLNEFEYYYIIGSDQAIDLLKWKSPEELLSYTNLIVANRPEYPANDLFSILRPLENYFHKIHQIDILQIGVSSKIIRKRIREDDSIKYLLPVEVESYIYKNNLYKEEEG